MAAAVSVRVYRVINNTKKQFKKSITAKTTLIVRAADEATTNKKGGVKNSFIYTLLLFYFACGLTSV